MSNKEGYVIVDRDVKERFKAVCKKEGRTMKGMILHVTNEFEKKHKK